MNLRLQIQISKLKKWTICLTEIIINFPINEHNLAGNIQS